MGLFDTIGDAIGIGTTGVPWGSIVSAGASLLGGERRNDAQIQQAQQANEFSAQQYASRYQTTVKDMQAAGLNPMLAYSQGPGSSPTGQQAQVEDIISPAVNTFNQSRINSAQVANIEADTNVKKSEIDLNQARASQARGSAWQSLSQIEEIDANVRRIKAETENLPYHQRVLDRTAWMLKEQADRLFQQGQTEIQVRNQIEQTVQKLRLENLITQADYDAMQKTNFIGRVAREIKPISDIGSDWLSPSKWLTNKTESVIRKGK